MKRIPKREYTAEFKELAVKRVKAGQAAGAAAKGLGLIEQALRHWVKAAAAGKLNSARTNRVARIIFYPNTASASIAGDKTETP